MGGVVGVVRIVGTVSMASIVPQYMHMHMMSHVHDMHMCMHMHMHM